MVQRIQTLFIAAAMLCSGLLFIFPVWMPLPEMEAYGHFPDGLSASRHAVLLVIFMLLVVTELASLLLFKKRGLQSFCVFIAILFNILYLGAGWLYVINLERKGYAGFSFSEVRVGAILPVISIIFLILANRYIKKDEALVKSMDRLR